jgi:hypothetical protein
VPGPRARPRLQRLKTIETGRDKKAKAAKLLAQSAATMPIGDVLDSEFNVLTAIGNRFRIRHHETDRFNLPNDDARDYLFVRMASLLAFVLRQTGRMRRGTS